MKQKLIAWTKPVLCACMAFSWWIGIGAPSLIVFGEYPYPDEDEVA